MPAEFLLILANYRCPRCKTCWKDTIMGFCYEQKCLNCHTIVEPFCWVSVEKCALFGYFKCVNLSFKNDCVVCVINYYSIKIGVIFSRFKFNVPNADLYREQHVKHIMYQHANVAFDMMVRLNWIIN